MALIEIVDLPINSMVIFHGELLVYQRVISSKKIRQYKFPILTNEPVYLFNGPNAYQRWSLHHDCWKTTPIAVGSWMISLDLLNSANSQGNPSCTHYKKTKN